MNRIATMTVIRGNGGCEAYWQGVVMEEMKKLNERHATEMKNVCDELNFVRGSRRRERADNLATYRAFRAKPVSPFKRLLGRLETLWCQFWGLGVVLGWWECDNDDTMQ